ncbi:toprim domain-containing protein [Burkholderia stagnalis]|uniref:Toprim domain-containing protein n=1 Tax=Burkholderia stagnalis TaxID=1503054 RepID=A0ABX9YNM5_9BURK|nr:toprim domain-containing protein [Burkholderia stagnalis]RQQ60277.1 toprim domain-containing protein [Burkholderia stagnalis]RQQ66147.1 toprim domain-containing protein [Burkholderia stagnalis]RQQ67915.1 toprim domain-containing protein [Burkholderia stagnalis]RQQ78744.1 toprim domain-containing protein [Burkholderia stagnalis]RQQ88246.1 toprim domain-containing protein [Burkholderia stagnalis]
MNAPATHEEEFGRAMAAAGFTVDEIIGDGRLRRVDGPEDRRGQRNGWYVLYADGIGGGAFGCWKTGLRTTWRGEAAASFTHAELVAWRARVASLRAAEDAERATVRADAAAAARQIWERARNATADTPYCVRKGVRPYGLKEFHDKHTLLVPMRNAAGELVNLQFVDADGQKRFKTGGEVAGCWYQFGGEPAADGLLLIGEGFATCASAFEVAHAPVVVAFNAGNLLAVAQAWRARLPHARIVLLADDDAKTAGNPGLTKATEAARAVGGAVAVPAFDADRPAGATDFNDLQQYAGGEAVAACIEAATAPPAEDASQATAPGRASPADALMLIADDAMTRTREGDPGALFDIVDTLRELRVKHPAHYARLRARVRRECREVQIGELERQMRSDVDATDEKSVADMLIEVADERCELFRDPDRVAYALLDGGGHRECWPVRSDGYREWLAYSFYQRHGRAPTDLAITTALATIEGKAKFDGDERRTHLRVASVDGAVWIDLCNEAWQAVEVTATGWRIVDTPPLHFIRTATMRALPSPTPGGRIDPLWDIVNIPEGERLLVLTWMLECFRNATPYAVLELTGEQGSAKSTTQHYLRELIDPNRSNNRAAPKNVDDVFVAAQNAHLMSFENLSHLPAPYQDALCVLATGGGYSTRRLFTNAEETVLDLKKPIALNGIAVIVTAQDLSDRALHVDLPTIEARETANQIQQAFELHRNGIFGGLLDVLAGALAELQTVRAEKLKLPRMADFAQLGEAVYRVHGRPAGTFLREYNDRRRESVHRTLEASPVAMAMLAYLDANPGGFEGTIGRLLDVLVGFRQDTEAWPKTPKGMGDAFRRVAPALRQIGIAATISDRRGMHGYTCSLKRIDAPGDSRPESAT